MMHTPFRRRTLCLSLLVLLGGACAKEETITGQAPAPALRKSWTLSFGSSGLDRATAMAVDASGNLILALGFSEDITVGETVLTPAGGEDVAMVKLNALGQMQWIKQFGGTGSDEVLAIACRPDGRLLITGLFFNEINFGGGALTSAGNADVFLAELMADGSHSWSTSFGGTGYDRGVSLAPSSANEITVFGEFSGSLTIGSQTFDSAGLTDLFIARYRVNTSTFAGAQRFGNSESEKALGLHVNAIGVTRAVGSYAGQHPFTVREVASSDDSTDVFAISTLDPTSPQSN